MKGIEVLTRNIERFNKWSGEWVAWLVVINAFAVGYDVMSRYVLGRATDWGYDVGWMLYAVNFMIGVAYTLQQKGHVRVDLIWNQLPKRRRATLDLFYWIIFVIPMCVLMVIYSTKFAVNSWAVLERSSYSPWRPYIFPFKTIIPIAFTMLGLQAITDCINNLKIIFKKG